jgi:hypothetical protein
VTKALNIWVSLLASFALILGEMTLMHPRGARRKIEKASYVGVGRTRPLSSRQTQVAFKIVIVFSRSTPSRDLPSMAFHLLHSGTFVHVLGVLSSLLDQEAVTVHQGQNDWAKGPDTGRFPAMAESYTDPSTSVPNVSFSRRKFVGRPCSGSGLVVRFGY